MKIFCGKLDTLFPRLGWSDRNCLLLTGNFLARSPALQRSFLSFVHCLFYFLRCLLTVLGHASTSSEIAWIIARSLSQTKCQPCSSRGRETWYMGQGVYAEEHQGERVGPVVTGQTQIISNLQLRNLFAPQIEKREGPRSRTLARNARQLGRMKQDR
jgi:hypothetical protein